MFFGLGVRRKWYLKLYIRERYCSTVNSLRLNSKEPKLFTGCKWILFLSDFTQSNLKNIYFTFFVSFFSDRNERREKSIQSTYLEQAVFRKFEVITFSAVDSVVYCIVVDDGRLNRGNIEFCVAGIMLEVNSPCKIKSAEEKAFIWIIKETHFLLLFFFLSTSGVLGCHLYQNLEQYYNFVLTTTIHKSYFIIVMASWKCKGNSVDRDTKKFSFISNFIISNLSASTIKVSFLTVALWMDTTTPVLFFLLQ